MIRQLLVAGIISGGIYALIASGFNIIYRTVRFFHFAHGVVYATGAYVAYTVFSYWSLVASRDGSYLSWITAVLAGVIGAGIIGVVIDRIVYRPLRKKKAPNLVFLLASFGVFIFIQNLIQLIFGAQILTLRTGPVKEGHHIFGAVITDIQILILVVSGLLSAALWLFIQKTKLGKAMRAVADDPLAASVVGINPERITLWSFAIGSALAGAAGILISLETNLEPTMGMNAILKGIIASIIGGIGSIPGVCSGVFSSALPRTLGYGRFQQAGRTALHL